MNLADLDPRDEWWADLCTEVAQAAPAHLDSLFTPAPDAEPDAPPMPSVTTGIQDSIRNSGPRTYQAGGSTPEDPA
jgi:hypothetical protein